MIQPLTAQILIFFLCAFVCIDTYAVTTASVAAVLLSVILAFSYLMIQKHEESCMRATACIGFLLCFIFPELSAFLPLFAITGCFGTILCRPTRMAKSQKVSHIALIHLIVLAGLTGLLAYLHIIYHISSSDGILLFFLCICSIFTGRMTAAYESQRKLILHMQDASESNELLAKENMRILREKQNSQIETATLKERNRIAREIHDNVGHTLTHSILQLGAIQAINQTPVLDEPLTDLQTSLNTAMTNIRTSVHDLHDESIHLEHAVSDILKELQTFDTTLEYDMSDILPRDLKYCFLTIVKEAVTNAAKHSNGDTLSVTLREHPGFYQLTVHDNGTDIRTDVRHGIGLTNIEDRVHAFSGTFRITTNAGFKLFISIPKSAFQMTV